MRAPFLSCPRIDYHVHLRDTAAHSPERVMQVYDRAGIDLVHNLDGGQGETFQARVSACEASRPARVITAFQVDYRGIDEPGWGEAQARALEEAFSMGARTVKEDKRLGLWVRDRKGRVPVDDPRLDPVWEAAGELGTAVTIHTADPAAFWLPPDPSNERYEELLAHPDWSFAKGYPPRLSLLEERNRVIRKHRGTTFVGAHVGNNPEDLSYTARCLLEMPNFHVDIAARLGELGRKPAEARAFFLEFQDRILFGTDHGVYENENASYLNNLDEEELEREIHRQAEWYRTHYRFLETDDRGFPYPNHPKQGRWTISGIALPERVLRKVYYLNAVKICPVAGERLRRIPGA